MKILQKLTLIWIAIFLFISACVTNFPLRPTGANADHNLPETTPTATVSLAEDTPAPPLPRPLAPQTASLPTWI